MNSPPPIMKPRLLDQARNALRTAHYSIRTECTYLGWIRRFNLFHHFVDEARQHVLGDGKSGESKCIESESFEFTIILAFQGIVQVENSLKGSTCGRPTRNFPLETR